MNKINKPEPEIPALPLRTINYAWKFLRAAAVFLLVCGTAYLVYQNTGVRRGQGTEWITRTTMDARETLTLPDGSTVFMNLGSSLSFPETFELKKREIRLQGEAYFEITPDEDRPFLISAGKVAEIEVLGTSFNLRTDPKNKKVFLNVLSGKVAFYPAGKRKKAKILEKDEQAVYHSGGIEQQFSLDLNFLSWKTNTLVFDNTPLPEVMDQLCRHYNKQYSLENGSFDNLTLTGTYADQSLDEVLQEMALVLDIEFQEHEDLLSISAPAKTTNE